MKKAAWPFKGGNSRNPYLAVLYFMKLYFLSLCFFPLPLHSRTEYALRHGFISCSTCHVSATGGGPLRVNGKQYSATSRGFAPSDLSLNDSISGDLRALYFIPQRVHKTKTGLALMNATASVKPLIIQKEQTSTEAVASYNFGLLGAGLRDAYVLLKATSEKKSPLPQQIQFGRFNIPFGILTDEHRTYVRMQVPTTMNDYEMGFLLSGNPSDYVHYDVLVSNGYQSGGNFTSKYFTLASGANIRIFMDIPVIFGASALMHKPFSQDQSKVFSDAYSFYTGTSFDRLSENKISGSLLTEAVFAKGWNYSSQNSYLSFFVPSKETLLQKTLQPRRSLGWNILVHYNLTSRWLVLYKFDILALDYQYLADSFYRHGIGSRHVMNGNSSVEIRIEHAVALRPEIKNTDVLAAQNAYFLLFHLWL